MHLRNCVDDSLLPLVCTCQAYAFWFPQRMQVKRMVGVVLSFFSLSITATSCFGSCSMVLPVEYLFSFGFFALFPHLLHEKIISF